MIIISFADVYSSLEPNDRVGDAKGPVVERDNLQVCSIKISFRGLLPCDFNVFSVLLIQID